jgi:hypothetical protein
MTDTITTLLDQLTNPTDQLLDRARFLADTASGILAAKIKGISEEDSDRLDDAFRAVNEIHNILDELRRGP